MGVRAVSYDDQTRPNLVIGRGLRGVLLVPDEDGLFELVVRGPRRGVDADDGERVAVVVQRLDPRCVFRIIWVRRVGVGVAPDVHKVSRDRSICGYALGALVCGAAERDAVFAI